MKKKKSEVQIIVIFLLTNFLLSLFCIDVALSYDSSLYYFGVKIDDVYNWTCSINDQYPDLVGNQISIIIQEFEEKEDYWCVYYRIKTIWNDDYESDLNYFSKSNPTVPDLICLIPVELYLKDVCLSDYESVYSCSGSRLTYTIGNLSIIRNYDTKTGILISYIRKDVGHVVLKYNLVGYNSEKQILGYSMLLSILIMVIVMFALVHIIKKKYSKAFF